MNCVHSKIKTKRSPEGWCKYQSVDDAFNNNICFHLCSTFFAFRCHLFVHVYFSGYDYDDDDDEVNVDGKAELWNMFTQKATFTRHIMPWYYACIANCFLRLLFRKSKLIPLYNFNQLLTVNFVVSAILLPWFSCC